MPRDPRYPHCMFRGRWTTPAIPLACLTIALFAFAPTILRAQGAATGAVTGAVPGEAAPPHGASSTPDPAIMATVRRLFDGMRAGDSAMVRSVFHPQLRMVTAANGPDGTLRLNVETSADGFVRAVGTPHPVVWDERIWNEKVEVDGPLASVWVDYAFLAGDKLSHCGVDHFLLVRGDDASWTILSLADTRRSTGCAVPSAPGGG